MAANVLTAAAINADAITEAKIADNALSTEHFASAFYARLGIVAYGTAQSATSTTLRLAASSAFADDELNGAVVVITGGTGVGQARLITDYVSSTDTATVDTWTTTPSGTITYVVFAAAPASTTSVPPVNVTQWLGTACATPTTAGVPEVDLTHVAGSAVSTSSAQLGVNVVQAGGTAWGSGAITASAIATGAIDADALAADAVDEILDEVVEGTVTVRQALRVFLAALGGKLSGAGTTTVTIRDTTDSTDRIVATVDSSGNRSAVTLTLT
jgi:hypothetical protein